jgi:chaperone modulatory protein CbpM
VTAALTRPRYLDLETFARAAGAHPDLVQRLVVLGLVDATRAPNGEWRFEPEQIPVVARVQRLRNGLALNYAAIGLVTDLLDRIAELECNRPIVPTRGGKAWT